VHPKPQMEDFAVTCPLVPDAPRLISGFCSSPRSFGFSFLQTLPRDNALAVLLAFGSAKTWLPDFHRHSYVPCPAHTFELRGWTPQAAIPVSVANDSNELLGAIFFRPCEKKFKNAF